MNNFISCSDMYAVDTLDRLYKMSEEQKKYYIEQSIKSGLIIDEENDIYIRQGYGALVGYCPSNCNDISDVIKFTIYDENRKKITGKRSLADVIKGEPKSKPIYNYHEYISEGYDLVIGPGGSIKGELWDKAVYCTNYLEILSINKEGKKIK